jgi:hypothetical protein
MNQSAPPPVARPETADAGRIRLGAGCKLPPAPRPEVADAGRIRLGAGCRQPRTAG